MHHTIWMFVAWWEFLNAPPHRTSAIAVSFWSALSRGCSYTETPPWDTWGLDPEVTEMIKEYML